MISATEKTRKSPQTPFPSGLESLLFQRGWQLQAAWIHNSESANGSGF